MPNVSSLAITFAPSISGNVGKSTTGSDYKGPSQAASLSRSNAFTNGNSNTSSLGADEFISFVLSVAAGASAVVDLSSLTDFLLQSGVSLARIKGYRLNLLSVAQDSVYGTTCTQVTVNGPIPAPVQTSPSTASTGGSIATGTYYYKITAKTAAGETTGSNEESVTTTGSASTVTLNWSSVPNATGYNIYRGSAAGSEDTLIATVSSGSTVTYTETGSETTSSVSPPTVNTAATPTTAQLNGVSPLSGFILYNGDYQEWSTANANGWTVGSNVDLYVYNNDASHSAALQITLVGGTT